MKLAIWVMFLSHEATQITTKRPKKKKIDKKFDKSCGFNINLMKWRQNVPLDNLLMQTKTRVGGNLANPPRTVL